MEPEMREFLEKGLVSVARMRAVEGNAITLGVGSLQMMESAGRALAGMALELSPSRGPRPLREREERRRRNGCGTPPPGPLHRRDIWL